LIAAALIATSFLVTTLQARITDTQDINKDDYLQAIADRIIKNPGTPLNWGTSENVPDDFGLAASPSTGAYELDIDKISRLNTHNNNALSYLDLTNATKLYDIALGITVSQVITLNIQQASNSTVGSDTSFTFTVSTDIESKHISTDLHCYIIADGYTNQVNGTTESGIGSVIIQFPTSLVNDALLVVFARAPFDERITSFETYNFANSNQETTPTNTALSLNPLNYKLNFNSTSGLSVQTVYLLTYSYDQAITSFSSSQATIPKIVDKSPIILVACGLNSTDYFEEWTSYPQIPLTAGSAFEYSEKNIFSYMVTVNGVLYQLEVSLGDINH
jgi:hypothetical protein